MTVKWTYEIILEYIRVEVTGSWEQDKRPPALYRDILVTAAETKAKGMILINAARGAITKEEAQEIGRMGGQVPTLLAVAYLPGEFPEKERVQNFTVARLAGSVLNTPFHTFYDEKEAIIWLQDAIEHPEIED